MLPEPDAYAVEQGRYPAPEGTRFAWRDEITSETFGLEWSVDPEKIEGKGCRYGAARGRSSCGAPAVAALNRGKTDRPRWWAYCAEHLFGRVLDDGKVFSLVLEEVAADGE